LIAAMFSVLLSSSIVVPDAGEHNQKLKPLMPDHIPKSLVSSSYSFCSLCRKAGPEAYAPGDSGFGAPLLGHLNLAI